MILNADIIRISVTQIWDCIYASKKRYCKQVPMTSKTKKSRKWLDFNYTPQFTSFCDNFIPYIKSRVLYSKNHFMDTFITLQYKFVYRTSFLHTQTYSDIIPVKNWKKYILHERLYNLLPFNFVDWYLYITLLLEWFHIVN